MSYSDMRKSSDCYKCKLKDGIQYNIPYLTKEYYAIKGYCVECNHEQMTFRPKDPEREKELAEAIQATREALSND